MLLEFLYLISEYGSNMFHDMATPQITQEQESVTNAGAAYTNADPGYRAVPKITKDTEGFYGGVTTVNRTGWGATTCGTFGTIEDRITNCATVFGANATWDGAVNGNAGQGMWKLVARTGGFDPDNDDEYAEEVWRDERTQLIWSSLVGNDLSWCMATGANSISVNSHAELDPYHICDDSDNQKIYGKALSACLEGADFINDANDDDADYEIYSAAKGGLTSASVAWDLPTLNAYQMAEVDGIRFVMPEMLANDDSEWTSSIVSSDRSRAFRFNTAWGTISNSNRENGYGARCVGKAVP